MNARTAGTLARISVCTLLAAAAGCASQNTAPQPVAQAPTNQEAIPATTETTPTTTAAVVDEGSWADETATFETSTANVMRASFAEEGSDFDPSISPDGTRLVFASTQHRRTADLYVKRADSRVVTQLTNDPSDDANPTFSPDGQKIAFTSNRAGNWDVYVMPATGGKAVQITSEGSDEIAPSWSPDGTRLVFSRLSSASRRWEMWVCDVSNPTNAQFIGHGLFPKWCPVAGMGDRAGERVLFQLGRERGRRTFSLWTIDLLDGLATNATEIASSANTALINPTWSPDGNWVAFAEVPASEARGPLATVRPTESTLWMININGEERVRLTGGGVSLSPVWSRENRMFFVSDRTGKDNIWSVDLTPAVASALSLRIPESTTDAVANVAEEPVEPAPR